MKHAKKKIVDHIAKANGNTSPALAHMATGYALSTCKKVFVAVAEREETGLWFLKEPTAPTSYGPAPTSYGPAAVLFHNALADHYDDGPPKSYEPEAARVEAVRHKMVTPHIMLADAGTGYGNHFIIQIDNTPRFEVVQITGYDPW